MPTRPLLDLSAAMWHIESSCALCCVTGQILIQWCGANHLHPVGILPQKRSMDELLESQSRTCSCPAAGGATGDPPHGVPHPALAP
jgi:hypothetical protein